MIDINTIKQTIKKSFKDDCMAEDQFEEIQENFEKLGYCVSYDIVNSGDWVRSGDESELKDFLAKMNINGELFYIEIEQRCSGGVEPYYYDPEISRISTSEDYNKSKIVPIADFNFKGEKVIIYSDGTSSVNNHCFENTESAINHLIK